MMSEKLGQHVASQSVCYFNIIYVLTKLIYLLKPSFSSMYIAMELAYKPSRFKLRKSPIIFHLDFSLLCCLINVSEGYQIFQLVLISHIASILNHHL